MDLIYLDYNCFQRGFDDPRQIRIQLEALACQEILIRGEGGTVLLVWSFMHADETILCPFPERKHVAFRLAALCKVRVGPDEEIYEPFPRAIWDISGHDPRATGSCWQLTALGLTFPAHGILVNSTMRFQQSLHQPCAQMIFCAHK